jgi:hypothetical protein
MSFNKGRRTKSSEVDGDHFLNYLVSGVTKCRGLMSNEITVPRARQWEAHKRIGRMLKGGDSDKALGTFSEMTTGYKMDHVNKGFTTNKLEDGPTDIPVQIEVPIVEQITQNVEENAIENVISKTSKLIEDIDNELNDNNEEYTYDEEVTFDSSNFDELQQNLQ